MRSRKVDKGEDDVDNVIKDYYALPGIDRSLTLARAITCLLQYGTD
jgi:hypothetical protein